MSPRPAPSPRWEGWTCAACVDGTHECVGSFPATGTKCSCGCNVEPWPFEHADDDG